MAEYCRFSFRVSKKLIGFLFLVLLSLIVLAASQARASDPHSHNKVSLDTNAGTLSMEFSHPVVAESWPNPATSKSRLSAMAPTRLGELVSGSVSARGSVFTIRLDDSNVDLIKGEDGQILMVTDASKANDWSVRSGAASGANRAGAEAANGLRGEYGSGGLPSSAIGADQRIVGSISAPEVRDDDGQIVKARTEISDGTLQIAPVAASDHGGFTVKVLATLMGFTSDGWISYGADEIYQDGRTVVEHGTPDSESQGCVFESTSSVGPDMVQSERQIALDSDNCLSVSEIGTRTSDAQSEDVFPMGDVSPMNNGVIRKANYTNWQEDPVGINVNWIRDWVSWQWNGTCVTKKVNQGHRTEKYEPTGWAKTAHTAGNSKECLAATKWSTVTFKGGQFFPACTGFKVTTHYSNLVQGLKDGHANFGRSRSTGGPPCHKLLHWESSKGNNVVG